MALKEEIRDIILMGERRGLYRFYANPKKGAMKVVQEIFEKILDEVVCQCDEAYKDRPLTDPQCFKCELEDMLLE